MTPRTPVAGNTTVTMPENRAYFPALDGLRAIAFLMVLLEHYIQLPWGWAGVNIFFVLSGFLITGILIDSRDDPFRYRNFYVRRTLRIFPLYYAIFLCALLLAPVLHWHWSYLWLAWPLYVGNFLRFLSPSSTLPGSALEVAADAQLRSAHFMRTPLYLGHLWSLCAEEQFYLFWPWVVFRVRRHSTFMRLCVAIIVTVPLLRIVAGHNAPAWMLRQGLTYSGPFFQLDALILGALLAVLWRGAHRKFLLLAARLVAAGATVIIVLYLRRTLHLSDPHWMADYVYPPWMYTSAIPFINVFSASLVLCALESKGLIFRVLQLRPLRWAGRISYGAYVFHDIFHNVYLRFESRCFIEIPVLTRFPHATLVLLSLSGTYLLAWLSYRFLETPFLNLKEIWTVRPTRQVS